MIYEGEKEKRKKMIVYDINHRNLDRLRSFYFSFLFFFFLTLNQVFNLLNLRMIHFIRKEFKRLYYKNGERNFCPIILMEITSLIKYYTINDTANLLIILC